MFAFTFSNNLLFALLPLMLGTISMIKRNFKNLGGDLVHLYGYISGLG